MMENKMLTGNKGEWSEVYVLFRLLGDGRLYSAGEDFQKLEEQFFEIYSIYRYEKGIGRDNRQEKEEREIRFDIPVSQDQIHTVDLFVDNHKVDTFSGQRFKGEADSLLKEIINKSSEKKRSFSIPSAVNFLNELKCHKVKEKSSSKSDILMKLYDLNTGYIQKMGFSIKSDLGNPPTLFNASASTNFLYRVASKDMVVEEGISVEERVNSEYNQVKKRVAALYERRRQLVFEGVPCKEFSINLRMIDGDLEKILSYALIYYYKEGINSCLDIVNKLETEDPLGFNFRGGYTVKFKRFLETVALGMTPTKIWNGEDDATGGYIVVTKTGDVLAYHLYRRNFFRKYLLEHTKFDTPSTSRNGFGSVELEGYQYYMKLNAQIRFK